MKNALSPLPGALVAAVVMFGPGPGFVHAQTPEPEIMLPPVTLPDAATDITREDWDRLVRGRTVTYAIDGEFWAQEMYSPIGNTVSIRLSDGTCMEGLWTHTPENEFCFAWDSGNFDCFRHLEQPSGPILIVPIADGIPSGTIQTVAGISNVPLVCGPALSS